MTPNRGHIIAAGGRCGLLSCRWPPAPHQHITAYRFSERREECPGPLARSSTSATLAANVHAITIIGSKSGASQPDKLTSVSVVRANTVDQT
ncbi:uncharacterized protein ARMOST_13714 [Armillaria ostoyae]|uniref:Uncharacterized protein n=1 Tax=Armillaria ostoyae TaxID=47428 RepID=A0A284RNJ5_ARMOS|nr:uncharacterized protein ARMOST_13714 [Armillaria ostoyae]